MRKRKTETALTHAQPGAFFYATFLSTSVTGGLLDSAITVTHRSIARLVSRMSGDVAGRETYDVRCDGAYDDKVGANTLVGSLGRCR